MAKVKNFSVKKMNEREGNDKNFENSLSYDPIKEENIDYEEWSKFISYYRYYIDEFAINMLGLRLYPFQRIILRGMARYQNSMFIACRGLGKSYLTAVFFICMGILYPGIKLGIASGMGQQARNVIIQKIKGELAKNESIAREIQFPIKTGADDCVVNLKNGSEIRAITLAQDKGGDSARSWRFNIILGDEARLIKDDIIEEILIPMTKTKRQSAIYHNQPEKGKMIFLSSAHLKISPLYRRFMFHYEKMMEGSKDYFVSCLPYQVGVQAGIFEEDDILKEKEKPTMTLDKFLYEYCGQFVGSSGDSYYPYDLTNPCRTLENCEPHQPIKCKSEYIIVHDVAISKANNSDNACTHVIKIKERVNGTYYKEVIYTKTHNGLSLPKQMEFLRELYHLKFPNAIKIVIDMRGNGEPLPSLFYSAWEYKNPTTSIITEYPPLVLDNDEDGKKIKNAVPMLRGVTATNISNNKMYTYMKASFEDGTLRLLQQSTDMDEKFKNQEMSTEEYQFYIQTDLLISELSNIKQDMTKNDNIVYVRIVEKQKRDRATSLAYGLSVIQEMEEENMKNNNQYDVADDDDLVYY